MRLNIIEGPAGCGKSTRLRDLAETKGMEGQILCGSDITTAALRRQINALVASGCRDVFVDECHMSLVELMLGWEQRFPAEVMLHVVLADSPPWTNDRLMDELVSYHEERPIIRAAGTAALARLVPVALRDSGQSRVVGRFLLGLYNGRAYPFTLTDLRSLDAGLFDDCMAVLRLDNTPEQEVHEYLPRGQMIFNQLREYWAEPAGK